MSTKKMFEINELHEDLRLCAGMWAAGALTGAAVEF
jgi:hypothetical protein